MKRGDIVNEKGVYSLTNREKKLILFLREMGWGEVKLRVENGQPVMIYEAIRTVRLEEKLDGSSKRSGKKDGRENIKSLAEVVEICLG